MTAPWGEEEPEEVRAAAPRKSNSKKQPTGVNPERKAPTGTEQVYQINMGGTTTFDKLAGMTLARSGWRLATVSVPARSKRGAHKLAEIEEMFWRSSAYSVIERRPRQSSPFPASRGTRQSFVQKDSVEFSRPQILLGSFSALVPGLRSFATHSRVVRAPNLKLLQRTAERGEGFDRLPRMRRRRWGTQLWVIFDSSERLIPYRRDYAAFCVALEQKFPWGGIRRLRWPGDNFELVPPSGTAIVALSDLGGLATSNNGPSSLWQSYGEKLRRAGCPSVAVVPGKLLRTQNQGAQQWPTISWQRVRETVDPQQRREQVKRLLLLAAPASRVEPGMLRQLRRLMGGNADPGLEAEFWQAAELLSTHPTAATVRPQERKQLLDVFAKLNRDLRRSVIEIIHEWRRLEKLEPVFAGEVKQLDPDSQRLVPHGARATIKEYFKGLAAKATAGSASAGELAWCWELTEGLDLRALEDRDERRALTTLWLESRDLPPFDYAPPRVVLWQHKEVVRVELEGVSIASWSPLASIASSGGDLILEADTDFLWKSEVTPHFVESWGCDSFGYWLIFAVPALEGPVRQRMRWMPAGHHSQNGPVSKGFWLFDTACTQALWAAVMGSNPSVFEGSDRPVENVSWRDVQEFIARINKSIPGLRLSLPSEAQWEYACRAGTTTDYSFGDTIDRSQVNFDGHVSKTVPCASLPANPWGLYEMHGNVWEWCDDDDPGRANDPETSRVLRGGSWDSSRWMVASGSRTGNYPSYREWGIGFRCARELEDAEPQEVRNKEELDRTQEFRRPFIVRSNIERLSFVPLLRPSWATAMGRDRFGLWLEFQFPGNRTRQKMRWINPGRFTLGLQADDEASDDEVLPHEVTISRGFWLFDTACTQALWTAVMGLNPSRLKTPNRPVENVSWRDAQEFIARINNEVPDLRLSLPSEAQWEYACRAGTTTAFSFGDTIAPNQANFAPHGSKTIPCASLPANPWGLYEMHGNVWEWCYDGPRVYSHHPMTDPLGPTNKDSQRALRGGSWNSSARKGSSAARYANNETFNSGNTGFRCARFE